MNFHRRTHHSYIRLGVAINPLTWIHNRLICEGSKKVNKSTMRSLMLLLTILACLGVSSSAFQPPRPALLRHSTAPKAFVVSDNVEEIFEQVDTFWQTFPYVAAAIVCGAKASAADFVAQSKFEEKDIQRNLSFVLYGALYQGIVHEYSFNHLYPLWFGTSTGLACVATKVTFNLLIQTTLLTLPIGYAIQAAMKEEPLEVALDRYVHDVQHEGLLYKCFALWGPVYSLTFSVVPEHWRVTFVAFVSFFWLILFSSISAKEPLED